MWPFSISPSHIAVFIPIIVVIGVFVTVIVGVIFQNKHKELEHRERMLAMEKGISIPEPPPKTKKRPRYLALRTWGIVVLGVGIAGVLGISGAAGAVHGLWGLTLVFMGLGLIISSVLERKDIERLEEKERSLNR